MNWIDQKYIQFVSSQLDLFKEKKPGLWNFRCPICGDSVKDRTKARGYIFDYKGDYLFKCQNCGDARPFSALLQYVSPDLGKEYRMEVFKESAGGKTRKKSEVKKPVYKRRARNRNKVESTAIIAPKQLENFKSLCELPDDHFMRVYAIGRGIPEHRLSELYYAKNMREIADKFKSYRETHFDAFPRLLLPFIDGDGKMIYIQGRAVGKNVPKGSRFYTLDCTGDDDIPKVYGMDKIDHGKRVKVVEGPIDSLFLSNCCGMGGADVPWHLFDPKNTTFVWDNEPRSKQITKRMKEAVEKGFSVCVWSDKIAQNDINDMVLAGRNPNWLDDYITNHSHSGLKAKMALAQFTKR